MAQLLAPGTAHLHTFLQGSLGQVAPQPTTLMLCRMPTLPRRLRELELPRHQWPAPLRLGREGSGFSTAKLKEFPKLLNRAIAFGLVDALVLRRSGPGLAVLEADAAFLEASRAAGGDLHTWGADYVAPTATGPAAERRQVLLDLREAARAVELAGG